MSDVFKKPRVGYVSQVAIGLYLAMGAYLGIEAKSVTPFFFTLLFGVFMSLPSLGLAGIRRGGHFRRIGIAAIAVFAVVILWAVAGFVERMTFLHASRYPEWLSSGDTGVVKSVDDIFRVAEHACGVRRAQQIVEKDGGQIVMRCGDGTWPFARTYVAHLQGR
ncbi:hypothetical protein [Burkholderia sp. Ac-20365]|uniref:hypothetical protein n=1 Tax=Burkholderia sp. Ac-20365 TaxID=2703897 RepID=UPI00197BA82A|nr:hypothetical protein [Burkholderia sp. Ac-20365]MBN3761359.1 hypothetical protein [Burkholderia sp. Ac-20365]